MRVEVVSRSQTMKFVTFFERGGDTHMVLMCYVNRRERRLRISIFFLSANPVDIIPLSDTERLGSTT